MPPTEEAMQDERRYHERVVEDKVTEGERHLAESRARLEDILFPEPDEFPRSETMRFLMGRNGKAVAIGAMAALFAVKPRLARTLMRLLPAGRTVQRFF